MVHLSKFWMNINGQFNHIAMFDIAWPWSEAGMSAQTSSSEASNIHPVGYVTTGYGAQLARKRAINGQTMPCAVRRRRLNTSG